MAKFLYSNNIAVAVENPLKIKRFAQMLLRRNKTDKADAQIICKYAKEIKTDLWKPASEVIEECKDMIQILEQ